MVESIIMARQDQNYYILPDLYTKQPLSQTVINKKYGYIRFRQKCYVFFLLMFKTILLKPFHSSMWSLLIQSLWMNIPEDGTLLTKPLGVTVVIL